MLFRSRLAGELGAVARPLGALDLDRPALAVELARDRIERAFRRAAAGGGVEDDVGVDQRATGIPSPGAAPR